MDQEHTKYKVVCEDDRCSENDENEKDPVHTIKVTSSLAVQIGQNASVIFIKTEYENERNRPTLTNNPWRENANTTASETENSVPLRPYKKTRKTAKAHGYSKSLVPSSPQRMLHASQPSKSYLTLYQISNDVMIQVRRLRDNGKWDSFEDTVVTLSHKYPSSEAQIVLSLEQGIAACYNNRLNEAKYNIKSAIHMASGMENSSVLIGRGLYYLSAVYRRDNKIGKAINCTQLAEQNFIASNVIDRCALTYERASALMDFILQCEAPRQALIQEVMLGLKQCIDECMILIEDETIGCCIQSHRYALIKIAMLLLDCRTTAGRRRSVSQSNIQDAEKYLTILKDKHWHKTSLGEKLQYYLAQADLYYRKQNCCKAREYACKALSMAESFGFNTEIKLANDRLEDIDSTFGQYQESSRSHDITCDDNPLSSHMADVSESTDSDWFIKP